MKTATKKAHLERANYNQFNITIEDRKKAIESLINSEETPTKALIYAIKITKIDFCEVGEWERFFETQELPEVLRVIQRNKELYTERLDPFNLEILIGAEKALRKKEKLAAVAA